MAEGNGKDGDNVFDFSAMKKAMEELRKEQERQRKQQEEKKEKSEADDLLRMVQAFGELFKPPSQEEINKSISQLADSLEKAAKAIREMGEEQDEGKGEEE